MVVAFGAQQVVSEPYCGIWDIVKVLTHRPLDVLTIVLIFLKINFQEFCFFYFYQDYLLQMSESSGIKSQRGREF